jgi:hypothetical protein
MRKYLFLVFGLLRIVRQFRGNSSRRGMGRQNSLFGYGAGRLLRLLFGGKK